MQDGGRIEVPVPDARVIAPMCRNPTLGSVGSLSFVSLTGTAVDKCLAGDTSHCMSAAFGDPSDVALNYGDFPFSRETAGRYFYAVVAAGHEETGFLQGAPGNMSDDVPSGVDGDNGSGDAPAQRTIIVSGAPPLLFPQSKGTHSSSFPPSQFMTIHLMPFDTTPDGRYVLVICPETATSRCDCAFDAFTIVEPPADGGSGGSSGSGGAPGSGGARDAASSDARSAGGSGHDAGMCPDM